MIGTPETTGELTRARRLLAEAGSTVVLTGAGISADSGVPTFRGADGLWKQYRAEDLATPQAFARDPRLVWEWYGWRRQLVSRCRPNAAHFALARWAAAKPDVVLVTQNVDGLHALAAAEVATGSGVGSAPAAGSQPGGEPEGRRGTRILELHGALFRVRCTSCHDTYEHRERIVTESVATLPQCRSCGSLLRPDIVWFGEALPRDVILEAFAAAQRADVCLVVGTSAVVHPASSLPAATADAGGQIVEVNPEETPLTFRSAASLRGGAAEMVPQLVHGL